MKLPKTHFNDGFLLVNTDRAHPLDQMIESPQFRQWKKKRKHYHKM